MKQINLQTPKGFRDFLPNKMAIRNEVIKRLRKVFEKYGYSELQTPSLEYQEVLLGKYGKEAEKLIYCLKDPGGRNLGLRYDLTVPLARVMSSNPNLSLPFKRYQIQPVWRAENTQKGRYREFYQCDIDCVGSASYLADAEIIIIINEALKTLGFKSYRIRLNSRKVLFNLMAKCGIPKDKQLSVIQTIDKSDKLTKDELEKEFLTRGLSQSTVQQLNEELKKAQPDKDLAELFIYLKKFNLEQNILFDPTLSRGLDYYTGPIFETVVTEPKIGSITGGGRYDNLLENLGGPNLPAVGTSFGLDRICDVIEEANLWPNVNKTTTQVLVTIFSPKELVQSIEVANTLRETGINTELYPEVNSKLDKQLKYANNKQIPYVVIIGPNEVEGKSLVLKNLKNKSQEITNLKEVIYKIR